MYNIVHVCTEHWGGTRFFKSDLYFGFTIVWIPRYHYPSLTLIILKIAFGFQHWAVIYTVCIFMMHIDPQPLPASTLKFSNVYVAWHHGNSTDRQVCSAGGFMQLPVYCSFYNFSIWFDSILQLIFCQPPNARGFFCIGKFLKLIRICPIWGLLLITVVPWSLLMIIFA